MSRSHLQIKLISAVQQHVACITNDSNVLTQSHDFFTLLSSTVCDISRNINDTYTQDIKDPKKMMDIFPVWLLQAVVFSIFSGMYRFVVPSSKKNKIISFTETQQQSSSSSS